MCGGKKKRENGLLCENQGAKNCQFFSIDFLCLGDSFCFQDNICTGTSFFFRPAKKKHNFLMREFLHADSGMRDGVTSNHVSINCQLWNRKSIKFNAVAIL